MVLLAEIVILVCIGTIAIGVLVCEHRLSRIQQNTHEMFRSLEFLRQELRRPDGD